MKAYILLSGGMDSATLLYKAIDDFGVRQVEAVSIKYGQRHQKEVLIAEELARSLGIAFVTKDISYIIGIGGLTDPNLDVPEVPYSELTGVSPTFVPFRNGLMLSVIASMAMETVSSNEECYVGYGAHAEDAENWAYPDCTPEFIGAMAAAIYVGTYHKVRLYTPLMWLKKSDIVVLGHALDVPWDRTWSCYKGEAMQCGICSTCLARKKAFEVAYVEDPTEYAA